MKIITIDAGKFQTKGLMDGRGIRFRTKMQNVDDSVSIGSGGNYYISWKGEYFLFGNGARDVDYQTSKHKIQHKLGAYIAASSLMKRCNAGNTPVNMIILAPLSMYTNQQAKEEFRQFILDDGNIEFNLNGEDVSLDIKDVTVFAEACGVPLSNPNLFKGKTVGLLDIGGLNVNGMIFKDMKPVVGTHFTENLGSLMAMEKIRKELNKEIRGANIQEYQMDTILKQGYYLGDKEQSTDIIKQFLSEHFKDILQVAQASNWDTKGLDVVISGGGGLDLGIHNIKPYIPQAQISNDPIWDNCKGGSMVGAMIYGQ